MRALTVSGDLIPRLLSGPPQIPLSHLGDSDLCRQAGRPLELVGSDGQFVGYAISDPENGVLRLYSLDSDDRPDDRLLARRLREAFLLRRQLGLISENSVVDSAFRLVNGDGDRLSGFILEVYGEFVIQYALAKGLQDWGRRLAQALASVAGEFGLKNRDGSAWPRGVVQKLRTKGSARPGKPTQSVVYGESPPESYLVLENGVPFEVHPLAGLNVGLFTDMREHRWRLGRFTDGARVLNLFAYTGALSVASVLGGASRVTSVDLSSGVLKWAKANFGHAGLDPEGHAFVTSDVGQFLKREVHSGGQYDFVIMDPPTYSAARAASWSLKKDLSSLVERVLAILADRGVFWLAVNRHQMSHSELDREILTASERAGRRLHLIESGGLPPDAPRDFTDRDADYLKVRIFRV